MYDFILYHFKIQKFIMHTLYIFRIRQNHHKYDKLRSKNLFAEM